jgi:hypothetical protein
MPLTLANARAKKVAFTAEVPASEEGAKPGIIEGHFNPRSYSPRRLKELEELKTGDVESWGAMLATGKPPLLCDWDLIYGEEDAEIGLCSLEEVGKPVPIETERLLDIPMEVLLAVVKGIGEAARPNLPVSSEDTPPSSLTEEEGPLLSNGESLQPPDSTAANLGN